MTSIENDPQHEYQSQVAGSLSGLSALFQELHSKPLEVLAKIYTEMLDESGGQLPRKADFDITRLGSVLAHTVLYDLTDPDRVVFRIIGEEMKNHFKVNPVGRSYLEFVPEARRQHALKAFRLCVETPCAMLSRSRQFFGDGLGANCEALGVPLMGENGSPATHMLFVDYPVDDGSHGYFKRTEFRFAHMRERIFIDLGHGVPADFVDLVIKE